MGFHLGNRRAATSRRPTPLARPWLHPPPRSWSISRPSTSSTARSARSSTTTSHFGHPGGSISSGRFVTGLLFDAMDYDVARPDVKTPTSSPTPPATRRSPVRALGAPDEILRSAPRAAPPRAPPRLRLEGSARLPAESFDDTPLFRKFKARPSMDIRRRDPVREALDGASGVGLSTSIGLALGAGTSTARRRRACTSSRARADSPPAGWRSARGAGTASLDNAFLHLDWNQSSMTRTRLPDGDTPGDYVQWNPMELLILHDWNVVHVPEGWISGSCWRPSVTPLRFETGSRPLSSTGP